MRQPTVNCLPVDCSPEAQFGMLARTTQLYVPGERPAAGPLQELAVELAEQTRVAEGLPVLAKTSYPVTPDAVEGVQLKVIGTFAF